MESFKCKECDKSFEILDSLRRHRSRVHKIKSEQTYIDFVLNSINPSCKCGCGERPTFLGIEAGFRDYKLGHAARVSNNWGHNKEAQIKSKETQKKMFENGELSIWNKGLTIEDERVRKNIEGIMSNPQRGKNISKALKGIPKTPEAIEHIRTASKKRWESTEEREKQSYLVIKRLIKNNYRNKKTKLEETFEDLLNTLNIENKYQHQVGTAIFDFYLIKHNILIEVDGDFHHCNPNTKHCIPSYPIQFKTVLNDKRKNKLAKEKGYTLLRFWEDDIKNRPEKIISELTTVLF